jgi:hypothetical protein
MSRQQSIAPHKITAKFGRDGRAVYRTTDTKLSRDALIGSRVPPASAARHCCRFRI